MNDMHMDEIQYSEKMVLAKALLHPQERSNLKLESYHFLDYRHGAIYDKIVADITFTPEDLLTVSIREPKRYGNYDFIRTITEFPLATSRGILNDQVHVYEFYKKRTIQEMMQRNLKDPTPENAMELSRLIQDLENYSLDQGSRKKETLSGIYDDLDGITNPVIIPSGFNKLDDLISGFEMQQLNLIAARPSIGKTAMGLELAKNLESKGGQVRFCSLESSEKNMTQRILASISGVELYKFKKPSDRMTLEEIEQSKAAIDEYYQMDLDIQEYGRFTPNMVRKVVNELDPERPGFIIIDYLTRMHSDQRHASTYEEVSDISKELKTIVQENENLTIIALSQLSRATENRQDKRPVMSDLRESGQIEQDANVIMMLYRDDYYNTPEYVDPNAPSELEVIVTKNKDGGLGTAYLDFHKGAQQIE